MGGLDFLDIRFMYRFNIGPSCPGLEQEQHAVCSWTKQLGGQLVKR
jgi:hypothetical protein